MLFLLPGSLQVEGIVVFDIFTARHDCRSVLLGVIRIRSAVFVVNPEGAATVVFLLQEVPVVSGAPGAEDKDVFCCGQSIKVFCVY